MELFQKKERTLEHISFRQELNTAQLEAVMHQDGPLLVIAGAGSGKTRTLVYRVARLILDGIPPENILLLTFTRKAAATMLNRAALLGGDKCQRVQGGTFHGFSHRMLRRYAHLLGYPPGFTIMDQSDSQDLIHLLSKQMGFSGKGKKFPTKAALCSIFSKAANSGAMVDEIIQTSYPHFLEHLEGIGRLFEAYKDYKKAHALMDYDDLLLNWLKILRDFEVIRLSVSEKFRYIMVDEYQDTNLSQSEIVRLMAVNHQNVMAVGDDSQSIYSFRGANFQNILDFPRIFPGTRIIKLEKNYRTTQPNLDCTNAIIANARQKFTKHLTAHSKGGAEPTLLLTMDEEEQARFVTETIRRLIDKGIEPEEIAVLFRAAFHSFQLEAYLNRAGFGFIKRGGMRLVDAAHIKDIISLLRIMINPLDRLSLQRILLLINKLGPKSVERIFSRLVEEKDPLLALSEFEGKAAWVEEVRALGKLLQELTQREIDLKGVLDELIKWYRPYLESHYYDDYPKRLQELEQLKAISRNYRDSVEFLSDLALDPPEGDPSQKEHGELILSTIHSAKGLEWKVVFMISLCEGRFPSPLAINNPEEIEEERRLFYVAATRAKDKLFFCCPAFINIQGAGLMPAKPSRFLEEIPEKYVKIVKYKDVKGERIEKRANNIREERFQSSREKISRGTSDTKGTGFKKGERVRHSIFGKGTIIDVLDKVRVKVLFDMAGEKTLRLDYTNLSRI